MAKTYALEVDSGGIPVPQYENAGATDTEAWQGVNGAGFTTGDEAHDAADAGNPIKIGGKAASSAPGAVSAGDRVNAYFDVNGRLGVFLDALPALVAGTALIGKVGIDQATANANEVVVKSKPGNVAGTALASEARTATVSSADLANTYGKGVHVIIDVTASADTPSVVAKIEGKDPASGKYYTILESAAITGTSTTVLRVHPDLAAVANLTISDLIPSVFRVTMTHADADSITYSVGYSIV